MTLAETLESKWPLGWTNNASTDTAIVMLGLVRVECFYDPSGWHLMAWGPGCDVELHVQRPGDGRGFGLLVRAARRELPKWMRLWIATHEYRAAEMRKARDLLDGRKKKK
jgi:hypothetical protein